MHIQRLNSKSKNPLELNLDSLFLSSILMLPCITDDGNSTFEFYKKPAKNPTFVHHKSAQPLKFKNNIIRNERNRISQRCTASSAKEKHNKEFDNILRLKGYSHDLIDSTKSTKSIPQVLQADPQPTDKTDWFYFKIPYVSDTVDYKLRKIFRQEGLPIRVAHKSSTLRQMLTPLKTNKTCDRINCPMSHTGIASPEGWYIKSDARNAISVTLVVPFVIPTTELRNTYPTRIPLSLNTFFSVRRTA